MKAWKRASLEIPCGAERGCSILSGEPYLELSGVSGWRKVRCGRHAGCAIPEVIDELQPERPQRLQVPTFTALQDLTQRFDARKAASGERDEA
jgi:hypothetical protein